MFQFTKLTKTSLNKINIAYNMSIRYITFSFDMFYDIIKLNQNTKNFTKMKF